MWWANYTTTHPANYRVPWGEFREAFRAHHVPVGVMRRKHQEFMDLKQGGRSVHEYSKLFNHLAQYALEQVDTNEKKKKDRFMNGLSTKLQERLVLNMGGTFPDFINNTIIIDDKIYVHKEGKKRKVMATSSNSALLKYRVVYPPPHPTYQSRQPYQQQQWAPHPPQRPHQQTAHKALPSPPVVLCLPAPPALETASGHT
jgi:hypothetical protein